MTSTSPITTQPKPPITTHPLVRTGMVLALLFVFLLGVNGLGEGFKSLGRGLTDPLFAATSNPFMALMVGILTTTMVQSSSVTTALVVGLVAAPGNPLPVENAVPIIMGANIGTTVTNTLVALAHVGRKEEFRRAFAVATCHDFFNFITVAVLLPLEMLTGYLQSAATVLSSGLTGLGGVDYDSPIKGALKAGLAPIKATVAVVTDSERVQAIMLIVLSGLLIFAALMLLVRVMRAAVHTRVEAVVTGVLDRHAVLGMLVGIIVTVMVQSSSITTSLMVPLAGAGLITLAQAFPVTVGANIGTTVTALLAALAATGENAQAGLTIALVHLLFNVSGTVLVFPVMAVRRIPLIAAQWLANLATGSRGWALFYIAALFYGVPALFAILNQVLQ